MKSGNQNSSHSPLLCPARGASLLTWHEETKVAVLRGRRPAHNLNRSAGSRIQEHTRLPSISLWGPSFLTPFSPSPFPLAEVYKLGTIIWGKCPFPLGKVNPSRGEKYVKFLDTSSSLVFQMLKFTQWKRSGFLSKCTLPCPKGKNFVHKSNACHT